MRVSGRKLGTLSLVAAMIGIAFSALLNKLAMGAGMSPIWLNVLRLGIAVLATLPFFLRKPDAVASVKALSGRTLRLTLLSGVMLAIHFATWAMSLAYADSVVAVAIWSTYSLMTVVGSSILLKERTPVSALLGIVLAIIGVAVCAIGARGPQLMGVLMALIAAVSQAVYSLCGRVVRRELDNLSYTTVVYSIACVLMLLCALVMRIPATGFNTQGILACIALALVCTIGGHSMQNFALKYFKAPTVSAAILTEVFTGPILVFLFLGEVPAWTSVVGGVIILAGVAWYMYSEWRVGNGATAGDGGTAEYPEV